MRQAFAYAIDRTKIESLVPHEFGGASSTLLPKELSLHDAPLFPQRNLERARTLFREGLGEGGFVKSDFPRLTISYFSGLQRGKLFEQLSRGWEEAFDIPIYLKDNDWGTHFKQLLEGEYQMGGLELNARWNDPLHLLECFEEENDLLNIPSWGHPDYRSLLQKAKQTNSLEKRDAFLKKAEAFLADEMPAIPLFGLTGRYLRRKELNGVFASSNFQIDFKWAYKS